MSLSGKLRGKNIGMTMSHYEFDVALLDGNGDVDPNIQMAGALNGQSFDDVLRQFDVLRFMNWQKTNVTPEFYHPPLTLAELKKWNERSNWQREFQNEEIGRYAFKKTRGVPASICTRVAAFHGSYPWICIPHGNSDAESTRMMHYIVDTTLAELERYNASGLTPIFEFSNEVWNSGRFRQQHEIANIALGRDINAKFGKDEGRLCFQTALDVQVKRTNELAEYVGDRGFVVLATQAGNMWVGERLLDNELSSYIDAVALAPYFGFAVDAAWNDPDLPYGFHPFKDIKSGNINVDLNWSYGKLEWHIAENLRAFIDKKLVAGFRKHLALIEQKNQGRTNPMRLWTYEGGLDLHYVASLYPHMNADKIKATFTQFNRSEAAGKLMAHLKQQFFAEGGELFVGYSSATAYEKKNAWDGSVRNDYFGHVDLQFDPAMQDYSTYYATPRLDAMLNR